MAELVQVQATGVLAEQDAGAVVAQLCPYDTTEMSTTAGEPLDVLVADELSGWTWVRTAAGGEGRVPNDTIEPVPGC